MWCIPQIRVSYDYNIFFEIKSSSFYDIFIHFPIDVSKVLNLKILEKSCDFGLTKMTFENLDFFDKILIFGNFFLVIFWSILLIFLFFRLLKYINNNFKDEKILKFSAYFCVFWIYFFIILIYKDFPLIYFIMTN